MRLNGWTGLWVLVFSLGTCSAEAPSTQPAEVLMRDITGVVQRPMTLGTAKAAVILFIAVDCPISNGYAPEVNRLCRGYESRHVTFFLVHVDADLRDADAETHAKEYGYTCPVLIDRKHELVKRVGARVTPEAVVIGENGDVRYRGRIDDQYVALGKRRFEPSTHDLRDVLEAIVTGQPIALPRTTAVGCAISEVSK